MQKTFASDFILTILMHSQFIKEFVNIIYLFYNNNIIIIRNERRVKEFFKIFVKHTSLLSFIVILKKINLFPSHLKSFSENFINYYYHYYSFL